MNNFQPLNQIADDLVRHQGPRMRETACHEDNFFVVGRLLDESTTGPCAPKRWLGETQWTNGPLLEALQYRQRQADGRSTITYTYQRCAPPAAPTRTALMLTVEFSVYGSLAQEQLPANATEVVLNAIGDCFCVFFPLMEDLTVRPLTVMAPRHVIDQASGVMTMRTPLFLMVAMDEETRQAIRPTRSRIIMPGDPGFH